MTTNPFANLETEGVVAVNSPAYLRHMLTNLMRGVVSVPLRDAKDTDRLARTGTTQVVTPDPDHGWLGMDFTSRGGADLAQISFTSGTEGAAKAVYLSHDNLHDVVTRLSDAMSLTHEIREYVGVPVYHSFGYGRARAVLNAGGQCYIPQAGFDLTEIRRMLRAGEINAISAVPSLWRILLQARDLFGAELQAVRWVEIGSQYMPPEDKIALRTALPNARIVQHYGLTEASRSSFLQIDNAPVAALASVGRATADVQLRINDRGRIEIRGAHVAQGIDDGTGYRALARDSWFETGDRGRIADGLLYFDGRADDVINVSGIKLSPDLIEAHVHQQLPQVGDFGVMRCPDAQRGEGILLMLTPSAAPKKHDIVQIIADYASTQGVAARDAITVRQVATLPRTATGKLQRKALADPATPPPASDGGAGQIRDLVAAALPMDDATSFADLEPDSLTHLQMTIALERALGELPAHWENIPLNTLIAQADAATPPQTPPQTPPLPQGDRNMNPPDLSFWQLVREDFRTNDASLMHQGFLMLLVHRFGNWRMDVRPRLLRIPLTLIYRVLNKLTQFVFGMKLDYTVKVGRRVKLEHFGGMILGARAIGDDVILRQNTTLGIRSTADVRAKPVLGNRVDVGAGAVIVGNITIGDNSIIGANTVVFSNIPANSVVMGVPGKIIGTNPRQNPSPLQIEKGG